MSFSSPAVQTYRFGAFELDSPTGELRRNGTRLKLQDQPLQVLLKLLESPGQIVPRDDLKATLWPADTFVDFDTGLNTAIKRLREALGDSADVPLFIETIPRRGYRFIAQVHRSPNPPAIQRAAAPSDTSNSNARRWLVASAGFIAAVIGAILWVRAPLPPPRVTRFTRLTSDGLLKAHLTTDGTRIYFNELRSDHLVVAEVSAGGGETAVLDSSVPGFAVFDVSSDGSKLLLEESEKGAAKPPVIAVMDLPSGVIHRVGNLDVGNASWTRDGHIIFSRGSDVFLAGADGGDLRKLLSISQWSDGFRFSPHDGRLRFTLRTDPSIGSTIWEANNDGSHPHQLFPRSNMLLDECCGEWTSNGNFFVFNRIDDGTPQLWALDERRVFLRKPAHNPVQLTSGPIQFEAPTPGREANRIYALGSQPRAELVRYDLKSGAFVPFLPGLSAGDIETSHNRKSLLYVKYPEGTLWRCNLDGSNRVQLTDSPLQVSVPHWSPDDQHIAFSGTRPGSPTNIYWISSEGGVPEKLTSGPDSDLDPTWSPDGKTLLYGDLTRREHHTYSIKSLDMKSHQVSDFPAGKDLCCPRWSPDGRFVAAINSNEAPDTALVLFSFALGKWTVLADKLGQVGYIAWAADSRSFVFDTIFANEPQFYRYRVAESRLEPIVSLKDVRRYWGNWGPWTGLAPDGSPLLVRDVSNQEIYALDLDVP
jgi:Tol biopolymer transport system component/DNA-binding winged helix-turn-helix (wHTH) protein